MNNDSDNEVLNRAIREAAGYEPPEPERDPEGPAPVMDWDAGVRAMAPEPAPTAGQELRAMWRAHKRSRGPQEHDYWPEDS